LAVKITAQSLDNLYLLITALLSPEFFKG
jgi:hypothetical protein